MSLLSHVEINVSNYAKSIRFYDTVLTPLGWKRLLCSKECTFYSDGVLKLVLSPVSDKFRKDGFHRKRIGLNHIAFYANSRSEVDTFFLDTMKNNGIPALYQDAPSGDDDYYAVLFEDPDRIKLEVVYAPKYCDEDSWPNTIESDFDPYE